MVNFPGRSDRRRRVLNEEVRSATGARTAVRADVDEDAPRYSDAAGVENHPQITDFVPRRYSTIALLGVVGVGATAAASALHYFALPVALSHGMTSSAAFDLMARGNVTSWLEAVILFIAAILCAMTYSIRRHRIDDFRGRYRVWRGAAVACLILSANSVANLHEVLDDVLSRATGWSALQNGAVWWMGLVGLPLAWVFVRLLLDVRECRIATALMIGAAVCYAISFASFLGYGAVTDAQIRPISTAGPLLLGHWLMFTAIVANARFVVLDAQGLITVRRREKKKPNVGEPAAKPAVARSKAASTSESSTTISLSLDTVQTAKTPADSSRWVDGSKFERERYDSDDDEESEDGERRISKADRKKLRRIKAQGRAA